MKAVRFHEYGGPEVLRYEDADRPVPAPGEVLIEVAATSFNPVDAGIRAGYLQQIFPQSLPGIPGIDVSGTVVELGDGVSGRSLGDRVVGMLPMTSDGAAAEFVAAPAAILAAAPDTVPLATAAALPSVALTAWQALFEHAGLRAGQRVLVNGAGGGVGGFAVQLAAQAGAFVIATAGPRSVAAVRAQGAQEIVDYTERSVADAVTEPVDVVLNLVRAPEEQMAALTGLLRPGGVVVSTGSPVPGDEERDIRSVDVQVRSDADQLAALVKKVDAGGAGGRGELGIDVSASYPVSRTALVHEQSEAGQIRGKVVLTVAAAAGQDGRTGS